ncbi:MAG: DNA repair protein RecN [Leptospirales bacterium]|nr:DNA repair protein RecN [Leptospirales bacterium]
MLQELRIENFGIIEELRIRPGRGLNVITGETGAGKTLLLTAIEAVLGGKAGGGLVRNGAARACVHALFDLSRLPDLRHDLQARGFPPRDGALELRREISADGRSRVAINGQNTSLSVLRNFSSRLVEIHGQHEHQRILDPETHLESLDLFAAVADLRDQVAERFQRYSLLRNRLRSNALEAGERQQRIEFLKFAIGEIDELDPRAGQFDELQNERALIQNSGKLFRDLCQAYEDLRERDASAIDLLVRVESALSAHLAILPELQERVAVAAEARYNLEAIADFLRAMRERLQFSPERLEDIEERLAHYQRLQKKYGGSTSALLETRDRYLRELAAIEISAEDLALMKAELGVVESELLELCEELSLRRRSVAPALEEQLAQELGLLGMPGARIVISIRREVASAGESPGEGESQSALGRGRFVVCEKGLDRVEFLLSANAGENLHPLRKVASGGELSRITLALKTIFFAHRPTPSVVFDEVDAGVGGEIAHAIGQRLRMLAEGGQALVVTHLHQIASVASHHYRLWKSENAGRTQSQMLRLEGEERIREMARMLGSDGASQTVLAHARELLQQPHLRQARAGRSA